MCCQRQYYGGWLGWCYNLLNCHDSAAGYCPTLHQPIKTYPNLDTRTSDLVEASNSDPQFFHHLDRSRRGREAADGRGFVRHCGEYGECHDKCDKAGNRSCQVGGEPSEAAAFFDHDDPYPGPDGQEQFQVQQRIDFERHGLSQSNACAGQESRWAQGGWMGSVR